MTARSPQRRIVAEAYERSLGSGVGLLTTVAPSPAFGMTTQQLVPLEAEIHLVSDPLILAVVSALRALERSDGAELENELFPVELETVA